MSSVVGDDVGMMWIAPDVNRGHQPYVADERTMLVGWLDFHRQTLLWKCAGLTAEQLKLRSAEPSALSLLGLVRHLAEVERSWFRRRVGGEDVEMLYCSDEDPDGDFDNVESADAEADFAIFTAEVDLARKVLAQHSLDEVFHHTSRKVEMNVRWVVMHMIEEYARHNGHADLLRERIDGITGA